MKRIVSLSLAGLAGASLIGGLVTAAASARSAAPVPPAPVLAATPVKPAPLTLSPEQRQAAGIVIASAERRALPMVETVPGEVQANRYRSAVVSTRIPAVVQQRLAVLGQSVAAGQPLATLFSVEVADAQAAFLLAEREWRRVQELGRDVVAGKRWVEAEIGRQNARARLLTYGLSPGQVEALARDGQARTPGMFTLSAPQAGTITADSFRIGEMVEAGRPLFELVDTSTVWVEARVGADLGRRLTPGTPARIQAASRTSTALVRQILPALDEHTRTLGVRLEVSQAGHGLTPGQFVQVEIAGPPAPETVVVPAQAVIRADDGRTSVFVEDPAGGLAPVPVTAGRSIDGLTEIDGLAAGTRLVVGGAFFLQSALARTATAAP